MIIDNEQENNQISIVIPTYNRAEFLDFFLKTHVPIFKKNNIALYISNNASTDHTEQVIEKWHAEYCHVHHQTFTENVDFGQNVERAMHMSDSEYKWLIGDSYEIPKKTLEQILDIIAGADAPYDFIITNLVNRIKDLDEKIYTDPTQAFEHLAWMVACISCNIYHKNTIKVGEFEKYRDSDFCLVGFVFDYIAEHDFKLYWAQKSSVVTLKVPIKKSGWDFRYFSVIFQNWPKLIKSLPTYYTESSKNYVIKSLANKGRMLNWRMVLTLRAKGYLNNESRSRYKAEFNDVAPKLFRYYSYFLTLIPKNICKVIIYQIEWTRRKNFQIKHFINKDKIM